MKKFIYFIIILIITTVSGIAETYKYVISPNTLNIRDKNNINGKIITSIPYKQRVEIIETSNYQQTINNITGQWEKIKWNGYTGWAFNGFLKKKHNKKCGTNLVNNIINYDGEELDKVLKKNYPDFDFFKYMDKKPLVNLQLTNFDEIPDILPGDDLILIKENEIIDTKVKTVYAFISMHTGIQLKFDIIDNTKGNDILYIRKDIPNFKITSYPKIIKIMNNNNNNSYVNLIPQMYKDFNIYNFKDISKENPKIDVEKKYNHFAQTIQDSNLLFIAFINKNNIKYYDFLSIYINNNLVYLKNSRPIMVFNFNNKNYLILHEWIPHSGFQGYAIYLIQNNKLLEVDNNYLF